MSQQPKKKLLDQVRDAIWVKHDSLRIEAFLTHLAVDRNVAAFTQNQALSALLFLYRVVLEKDLERPVDAVRAKRPKRLPMVLTKEEACRVAVLPRSHRIARPVASDS